MKNGFTLIELVVVITIVAVLSGIILVSVTQYISKGKDSGVIGNLAVLVPAGEAYYTGNSNSYIGFCDSDISGVVKNAVLQMPINPDGSCSQDNAAGLCCGVALNGKAWAACANKFSDPSIAFCVDSRGVKEDISSQDCTNALFQCP